MSATGGAGTGGVAGHMTPTMFVEMVRGNTDNTYVAEIIRQMDAIGRKHFSGGGSGYLAYGEPELSPTELDAVRTQFGLHKNSDMRVEELPSMIGHSGVLDLSELSKGEIRILDPVEVFETIKSVKPTIRKVKVSVRVPGTEYSIKDWSERRDAMRHMDKVAAEMGKGYSWDPVGNLAFVIMKGEEVTVITSPGLDGAAGAVINTKGAKALYDTGKYLIIDIAPGDHAEVDDPAEVYLRVRAPAKARTAAKTQKKRSSSRNRTAKARWG